VFVALGIHHAMRMPHIVMPPAVSLSVCNTWSYKRHNFWKNCYWK